MLPLETLTNDRNILHLLLYKSKNQHKSSLWFKWLQMLKRQLERIISHLSTHQSPEDSDPDEPLLLLKSDTVFASLLHRLFTAIIPNAHRAFTTLITSTQYASLGMMMLACLARIHDTLHPFLDEPTKVDTPPPIPAKEEEEVEDEDAGEVISRDSITTHQKTRKITIDEDEGTVIKRQKVEIEPTPSAPIPTKPSKKKTTTATTTTRTAIDDLFADL
ncbi:hypothetical protein TWF481_005439 [Arthrobotrys musiformis]|uniref:RNase MRP protein 1 RNA binding domain-containing protein n=1 Tax=Arthrobotrys musiformis TaxID=47236 RepID=A0AAV9WDS4_9PEZI